MYIKEINIVNFKSFKGSFNLKLNDGLNLIVGDNEAGKSTILEAIHLALTGVINGKYLKNELSQYLFNNEVVSDYISSDHTVLPFILIEIFLEGDDVAILEGDANSKGSKEVGISLKIAFDEKFKSEYSALLTEGAIKSIPVEYYDIFWSSFARDSSITSKSIPLKSALIDSSSHRFQNGSDICISHIVRNNLDPKDLVGISQTYRKMKDTFIEGDHIKDINAKIKRATSISTKEVHLSVDFSSKTAWENNLMTYLDNVPFHFIGKGEQSIIKTKLALSHKKTQEASVILLEEPENHLSHTKLNEFIFDIKNGSKDKQIIISTHSSFVANKLGLDNLILLNDKKTVTLKDLDDDTKSFFEKLAGYDTLRLILCKKAILVEGDSDELILQRAYMLNSPLKKLPIEDGVDVISVGTSFLRFLKIAEKIKKNTVVVTDNDGDVTSLQKKYDKYLNDSSLTKDFIKICFDTVVDTGTHSISGKPFNYNTLEPKLLKANGVARVNEILGVSYSEDELHTFMKRNKTDCALKFFQVDSIIFPQYILDAIK